MANSPKTVKRQPFGPNETDIDLCYFVSWDSEYDPEDGVAERWAHFSNNEDALAYFAEKIKNTDLFVWKGELGISEVDNTFDWFHTQWSKNLEEHLTHKQAPGKGYRFSNDAFEAFDSLEFEEEEAN